MEAALIAKRPKMINGSEYDAFCERRVYCYLGRPGVARAIKRAYRRRWRREARSEIAAALID